MPPPSATPEPSNVRARKPARGGPVRAALMIGVSKTGSLPRLQAAVDGAVRMGQWAVRDQGFEKRRVKVITDQKKPVQARQLIDAVLALLKDSDVEQLIIYFAGHGVNNGGAEVWLLSDAPRITSEAVNLDGSAYLASQVGVPHVVFISDACRTAADGIQAQRVHGVEIFENKPNPAREQAVDIFFATRLGAPSHEIRDPNDSAGRFTAVYTEELIGALEGRHLEVIQEQQDGQNVLSFVRPRPLGDYLERAVGARLQGVRGPSGPIVQTPYARLTSREQEAWLARFVARGVARGLDDDPMEHTQAGVAAPESVGTVVRAAMQSTVRNREADAEARLRAAVDASVNGAALVADAVKEAVRVVGPTNFETRCGFKVRGRKVVDAVIGPAGMLRVFPDTRQGIVVHSTQPAASVLIEFEGGVGIVLPAIQDFIGELTFANDDLIGVAYEPSDNSTRWPDYAAYAARFRTLRALAGSSVRLGVFRLEHEDAGHLATLFANAKSTDPVLALYAAYSYHELHQAGRLADVYFYTQGDLNTTFFDIAMLAGKLGEGAGHGPPDVFPSFPLLAQGWALLSPKRITLPAALSGLRSHLVPSLWSVFDAAGVAILRAAIQSGSMR